MQVQLTSPEAIQRAQKFAADLADTKAARRELKQVTGASGFLSSEDGAIVLYLVGPKNMDGLVQAPREKTKNNEGCDAFSPDMGSKRGVEIDALMQRCSMPIFSMKDKGKRIVDPLSIQDGKVQISVAYESGGEVFLSAGERAILNLAKLNAAAGKEFDPDARVNAKASAGFDEDKRMVSRPRPH